MNHGNALVVGRANMDLALSLKIYKIFQEKVGKPHFGYAIPKPSVWEAIENWVRSILPKEKYIN